MNKYLRLTGILILLIILLKVDRVKLVQSLYQLDFKYLLIAWFLNIPQLFFKSYRWNRLLVQQRIHYPPLHSFLVYLSSLYIGFITPGRVGEFVKVIYLKKDAGVSLSKGFSSVLIDRLFDLYFLILLGFIGVWYFDLLGILSGTSLVLIVLIVLSPLMLLHKKLIQNLLNLLYNVVIVKKVKGKIEEKFTDFYEGIYQIINYRLLFSALLTCAGWTMFFMQCFFIVMAMDITIDIVAIILFMAISNLISFVPISISGLGTRDATLIYLFALIGLKPEIAVSYAFLVFITFFVCGGLIGAVAFQLLPLGSQTPLVQGAKKP